MTNHMLDNYVILDFEASSQWIESWPIEVGVTWFEQSKPNTWSSLIKPAPHWNKQDFDVFHSATHRLSVKDLRDAPEATQIALSLIPHIAGRTVVSDQPDYIQHWLAKLVETVHLAHTKPVTSFEEASKELFSDEGLRIIDEALSGQAEPRRAGPDSARLASAWEAALREENKRSTLEDSPPNP